MTHLAAIALGSNLTSHWGPPDANLREAIQRVRELGSARAVSSFYATAPVGYLDQPNFTNGAMLLNTELEPLELMHALLEIERALGRDRSVLVPAKGPASSRHGRASLRPGTPRRDRARDGRSPLWPYHRPTPRRTRARAILSD
jgi:2-amino-4-hydroxy-6-hydroxymethyldihydropteridine diphosphokinase